MRAIDPFPDRGNDDRSLEELGIVLRPRLQAVDGSHAIFEDDTRVAPKTVVWATGYADDFSWMAIDGAVRADGRILHDGGVSPVPRLFYVGRPWQRNRASGLILGAGEDARYIVERIGTQLRR